MDAFTLVVASALTGTIMAVSMGLLYLASSRRACLFDWALAGLYFTASSVLGAVAIKFQVQHIFLPAAANTLYIAGHFGVLAGIRRHLGLDPRWEVLSGLVLLVLGVHLLPYVQESVMHRMFVFTPVIVAINFCAARLLWRRSGGETRLAYLPLIVLELFFMTQQGLRTLYLAVRGHTPLTFLGSQFLQTSGSLFVLVFLSVATMSCALIVTHQQALALRLASLTDVLTGWLNRRALHDIALREFRRSRRTGAGLFFITFDIDHFKSINDRHGHGVGDAAICHVTALSGKVLRGYDALFRIGGEEFAVLVAGNRLSSVCQIAERLRELVAASPLAADGQQVPMTVSVGVAALAADDDKWEDILRRADEALYHAKQHGRNRVSVHGVDLAVQEKAVRLQAVGGH
jgi:diguanylate cyclase (GGDEF)-like protein